MVFALKFVFNQARDGIRRINYADVDNCGSPRVRGGATSDSRSATNVSSWTSIRLRPAPARRIRVPGLGWFHIGASRHLHRFNLGKASPDGAA